MNPISLSSRNKNAKAYKEALRLFNPFKKRHTPNHKSLNHEVDLQVQLPFFLEEDTPKKTPRYQSLLRYRSRKSSSTNLNLSSLCKANSKPNLIHPTVSQIREAKEVANDNEFLQFRNESLMKNYKDDTLFNEIRINCASLFAAPISDVLEAFFIQFKQSRQLETSCLFTKFSSSNSVFIGDYWREVVSITSELTHCLLKVIEALVSECSKEKKKSTQHFFKLNQVSSSSTPSLKKIILKPIELAKEETVADVKLKMQMKEGQHKLSVYYLEEEIKALTYLLKKQKDYTESNRAMEAEIITLNSTIAQLKRDSSKKIESLENEIMTTREKTQLYAESFAKVTEENEAFKEKTNRFEKKANDFNVVILKLNKQIKEHQGSIEVLLKEKEDLTDEIKCLRDRNSEALFTIQELRKRLVNEKKQHE